MKTQIEEIEWHEYPAEKPPRASMYLISRDIGNGCVVEPRGFFNEEWQFSGELMNYVVPDDEYPIVAWAKLPKGWIKKKMKTQIEQCEYCEWVRAEQTLEFNEICVNEKSPYYMKIVNTDIINMCDLWEERIE